MNLPLTDGSLEHVKNSKSFKGPFRHRGSWSSLLYLGPDVCTNMYNGYLYMYVIILEIRVHFHNI